MVVILKVGELKRLLDCAHSDNEEVRIVIKTNNSFIGGSRPTVGISHANIGFDWERGWFLLVPNEDLIKVDEV